MNNNPYKSSPPENSEIQNIANDAYFKDSWSIQSIYPELSAFQQFIKLFTHTPKWIDYCMQLRNKIVKHLGLKDLGSFSKIDPNKGEASYDLGDRIGIFTLIQKYKNEIIVGDDDKHLNVILSIHKNEITNIITVTTVVHVKNWLGRIYMLFVKPMHKIIAPSTLKSLGK